MCPTGQIWTPIGYNVIITAGVITFIYPARDVSKFDTSYTYSYSNSLMLGKSLTSAAGDITTLFKLISPPSPISTYLAAEDVSILDTSLWLKLLVLAAQLLLLQLGV